MANSPRNRASFERDNAKPILPSSFLIRRYLRRPLPFWPVLILPELRVAARGDLLLLVKNDFCIAAARWKMGEMNKSVCLFFSISNLRIHFGSRASHLTSFLCFLIYCLSYRVINSRGTKFSFMICLLKIEEPESRVRLASNSRNWIKLSR